MSNEAVKVYADRVLDLLKINRARAEGLSEEQMAGLLKIPTRDVLLALGYLMGSTNCVAQEDGKFLAVHPPPT